MLSAFSRAIVVAFSILIVAPAWAGSESLSIDVTKLSPDVAKSLIQDIQDQKKLKETPIAVTPSQAHEWAGVGKEVAAAISETAKGLSLEVNQFVNTPVGWWAMFFLVWKLLGASLVKLTIGTLFVLIGSFTWWRSLRHFFWGSYAFADTDTQIWCAVFHVLAAAFLLIITCIVIFGIL